ncbi:alpha/beta hydrolase family protein [Sphingomonas sp. CJ20]
MFALALSLLAPVTAPAPAAPFVTCDASWHDAARNRDVPVRIRIPAGTAKVPVILFSHGLGGSLDGGTLWAEAWAGAGFAVVNLQHPGSDRSILGTGGLRAAANATQLIARVDDVHFALDQLGQRRREGACDLTRIDLAHIGMSGHSFGAHTTQAIAGQRFPGGRIAADSRVKAALAFSPAPPRQGDDKAAFGAIAIPFFSITGTADTTPALPGVSAKDRERPFAAMPPGGKYLMVLAGATHATLSGTVRFGRGPSDADRDAVIGASTLFWRWTLLGDTAARRALDDYAARLPSGARLAHK